MSNLKEKIEEVKKAFDENNAIAESEIKKIIEGYVKNPSEFEQYQPQYRTELFRKAVNEKTNPIMEDVNKMNIVFNQKVKAMIEEEKSIILPKPKEKSADYSIRISNALKYLEIEGEKLEDDTAYEILKDFVDDYEQMKLFKNVIKRQMKLEELEGYDGKCILPKTFGNFNKLEMIINTFSEMESIANVLFLKNQPRKEQFIFYNARVELPLLSLPSYQESTNQRDIINLAEIIDSEVKRMNNLAMDKSYVNITE